MEQALSGGLIIPDGIAVLIDWRLKGHSGVIQNFLPLVLENINSDKILIEELPQWGRVDEFLQCLS